MNYKKIPTGILAYSPFTYASPTPGQIKAWRLMVTEAGIPVSKIAELYRRKHETVAKHVGELPGVVRRRKKWPIFIRKYLAREKVYIPENWRGIWERFYRNFILYRYKNHVGGINGAWLAEFKLVLRNTVVLAWKEEMEARANFNMGVQTWAGELAKKAAKKSR